MKDLIKAEDIKGLVNLDLNLDMLVDATVSDLEDRLYAEKEALVEEQKTLFALEKKLVKERNEAVTDYVTKKYKEDLAAVNKAYAKFSSKSNHTLNARLVADQIKGVDQINVELRHGNYSVSNFLINVPKSINKITADLKKVENDIDHLSEKIADVSSKIVNIPRYERAAKAKLVREMVQNTGIKLPQLSGK